MRALWSLSLVVCLGVCRGAQTEMPSPDGRVLATLSVNPAGALQYHIGFKHTNVVEPSALGISIDGVRLGEGVRVGVPACSSVDESYATRGSHRVARDHYSSWRFPVRHLAGGRSYFLEFRVYNDGVAYRYIVPGEGSQHVDGESSSWKIMADARVWYFERLSPGWKLKSYAGEWLSTDIAHLHTATPAQVGPVQGTPLVFELPAALGYALVTKAALYNYSGMRLEAVGDRTVVANFSEGPQGFDVAGPVVSPWHATLLADDLNALVNSDFIANLNPAPDSALFADTGYIKPGRSTWSWETVGLDSVATQRDFIDLAAELGFEYSMVDDGWKQWPQPWETMKALCDHAARKSVGIWLWVDSKDIRDPAEDYGQMRSYLDRVAASGAVGIKIDFMNGETKALVDFEIATLRQAAQRKLLIDFHGCHASTGEARTYPNELSREGIRGIEVNKMREGPLTASHNAALPFTRFVVGHADYTPILYTNPGPTTWAHQLATLIVFTSPLQVYAEHPSTMMNAPRLQDGLTVMQAIPTVWDETMVLPGSKIGDLAAFARRTGADWFVGILNGVGAREYTLDFSFLSTGRYEVTLVQDDLSAERVEAASLGVNRKANRKQWTTTVPFRVSRQMLGRAEPITVALAESGGIVAHIVRK